MCYLAKDIIDRLANIYREKQHNFVLKNFFIGSYECDLFSVSKSGYTNEFEVKISKKDYKQDFKKYDKHFIIKDGFRTNKFWFVLPEGLVGVNEIPKYAGLIYVNAVGFTIIKQAPFLHRGVIDNNLKLLKAIAQRCYNKI